MNAFPHPWLQEVIEMTSVYIQRDVRADAAQALVLLNAGLENATAAMRLWLRRLG